MSDVENNPPAVPAKPRRKRSRKRKPARSRKVSRLPPWNVVLLDDDQHTYEYVIDMVGRVFGFDPLRGYLVAREVDGTGRAIVFTAHRELAELKREQIMSFGADPLVASCQTSMRATIEPAP